MLTFLTCLFIGMVIGTIWGISDVMKARRRNRGK
jgi:hypothetical protein